MFNALFDIFNSRNLLSRQFKAPLCVGNQHKWLSLFSEAAHYIRNLKKSDGTLIIHSRLKTGFIGFLAGISAFEDLFQNVVVNGPLNFILTYKFSQDHLELFFAAVRCRLGSNNNPSCKQFNDIVKRLLVHNQIQSSSGNVLPLDSTVLLTTSPSNDLLSLKRDAPLISESDGSTFFKLGKVEKFQLSCAIQGLTSYKKSGIFYISGYVVKMVEPAVKCEDCKMALHGSNADLETDEFSKLQIQKSWGRLKIASQDVVQVCFETEKVFCGFLKENRQSLPKEKSLIPKLASIVLKNLFGKTN